VLIQDMFNIRVLDQCLLIVKRISAVSFES